MQDQLILPTNYCLIAEEWLKRRKMPVRYWRGSWLVYNGRHYEETTKTQVDAAIARLMNGAVTITAKDKYAPFVTTTKIVNEVEHQLMWHRDVLIPDARAERTGPDGEVLDFIPCRNGLLDIKTGEMLPHSPDNLFLNSLAFDYDPSTAMTEPVEWMKFMRSLWPNDQDAIDLLQEFLGYIISGDTSEQKIFFMFGPARSGKGTIEGVIKKLLGENQCVGINADAFATNFGMQKMVGKSVSFMPDFRNARMNSTMTERLLTISGQDLVSVDRKYKDHWLGVLPTRIVILSNEVPHMPDASGVIASRFIPMVFEECFLNREDKHLADKLANELPQILHWAIEGLKRLRERGQFGITAKGQDILDKIGQTAAPQLEFFSETIETDLEGMCAKMEAFEKYTQWCEKRKHVPSAYQTFCNRVKMAFPHIADVRPRQGKERVQMWKGIRFRVDEELSPHNHIDLTAQLAAVLHRVNILRAVGQQMIPEDERLLDQLKSLIYQTGEAA